MHVRCCPECGEEFRPEIVNCSDCGALLQDRYEDEAGPPAVAPPVAAPPEAVEGPPSADDYAPVFTAIDSVGIRRAAAALADAGVVFRVSGSATGFRLLVPLGSYDAAMEALRGREGAVSSLPDTDPVPESHCPSCGAEVPAGAVECPECGLVVGDDGTDAG